MARFWDVLTGGNGGGQGPAGPPGPQGIQGEQGIQGIPGQDGGFGDYGSFYSLVDQHHAQNTPSPMEFEITDLSNGISITNDELSRPSRITFSKVGKYNIAFSAQLHHNGGGGSGTLVDIWLKHNGNTEPATNTKVDVTTNSPYIVAAWNFFVDVDTLPQWFEIYWNSANANIWMETVPANGIIPAVPSIILTVNQVG